MEFQMQIRSIFRFSWSILVKCFHLRTGYRKTWMPLLEKNIIHKYWLFCYRLIASKFDICGLLSFNVIRKQWLKQCNNSVVQSALMTGFRTDFTTLVWNFCRWVADVPPRETSITAKSEEKRLLSQATIAHAFKVFVWRNDGLLPSKGWSV